MKIILLSLSYMDNLITPIFSRSAGVIISPPAKVTQSELFNDLLTRHVDDLKSRQVYSEPAEPDILIGKITAETPTVSELLIQHKELSSSTWDIIKAEQNKNNDYTKIQPGTRIYYNRKEGTLSWSIAANDSPPFKDAKAIIHSPVIQPENNSSFVKEVASSGEKQPIGLGRIDSTNTTVSHLLKNHPQLREHTWNLLASSVNKDKPFHRIADGTQIYLNEESGEITWNVAEKTAPVSHRAVPDVPKELAANATIPENIGHPATDLSEAVQRYLGTSYDKINCYELLVKGLRNMDIPYNGRDGLYTKLTSMARDNGMAPNAYLNGEGIVKAAGSLVLSKNYPDIANWRDEAATLMREITPLLDNGQILSFSTEKRGHTGIVSQQNNQWTFINSGRLDNSVDLNSVRRGVGEEVLHKEILNWFKLAHAKKETLSVTLGRLEQGRIHTASNMSKTFSKRI